MGNSTVKTDKKSTTTSKNDKKNKTKKQNKKKQKRWNMLGKKEKSSTSKNDNTTQGNKPESTGERKKIKKILRLG